MTSLLTSAPSPEVSSRVLTRPLWDDPLTALFAARRAPHPFQEKVSGARLVFSTGRENDGTGLLYHRSRYYHPTRKRFISEDPIGFGGGANFYVYCANSPTVFVDPSGLFRERPRICVENVHLLQVGPIRRSIPGLKGGPFESILSVAGTVVGAGVGGEIGAAAGVSVGFTLGQAVPGIGGIPGAIAVGFIGTALGGATGGLIGGELGGTVGRFIDEQVLGLECAGRLNCNEPIPPRLKGPTPIDQCAGP